MAERFRLALVAGGSGAVGGAICQTLARAGFDIALTYRGNAGAAVEVGAVVEAAGRTAAVHRLDLTDVAATRALVEGVGELDAVVYAAGRTSRCRK